jgi:hypothetical protein
LPPVLPGVGGELMQAAQTTYRPIMTNAQHPPPTIMVKEPPPSLGLAPPARRTATFDVAAVASTAVAAATVEPAAVVPTALVQTAGSSDGRGCGEHTQPVVTAAVAAADMLDAMD